MQSLNETKAGEICTIKWMTGMPEIMDQIRQYDVSEGKTVQIISRILGGVIVGVQGHRILISDDAACRIKVLRAKGQFLLMGLSFFVVLGMWL